MHVMFGSRYSSFSSRQLKTIKDLSKNIIQAYTTPTALLPKGKCDELLQNFHRFDEDLSVIGKWQGGSVTGVCRGYGTSKVREGS